jgi:hypothetical protein
VNRSLAYGRSFRYIGNMSDPIAPLKARLAALHSLRGELETIRKEAFMAAPPMPGGGGMPMDPSMMQGGPPMQGPPIDPATGMPMDPAMMQGGPPMDPSMMQGGPPMQGPPVDPATGMPMDPAMMQGGPPPQDPGAGVLTPEMLEELLGVIEELAAASEQTEAAMQQLAQGQEELAAQIEEIDRRLAGTPV